MVKWLSELNPTNLQVIGAGCGRTGTSSLREALNLLGFRTYHMRDVVERDHLALWERASGEDADHVALQYRAPSPALWASIFDGDDGGGGGGGAPYTAVVDFPAAVYFEELAVACVRMNLELEVLSSFEGAPPPPPSLCAALARSRARAARPPRARRRVRWVALRLLRRVSGGVSGRSV